MCNIVFLIASLALISGQALADDVAPTRQGCSEIVKSMDWNNTALFGSWLQLSRHPNGNTNACMQFRAELLSDNKTLSFNASHSSTPTSLWQDINEPTQRLILTPNATTGYNITLDGKNHEFVKLLQLVNSTYLVGCGYTNASNSSTGYGFILGRDGANHSGLITVNNDAALLYKDFANNSYTNVIQEGCIRNSASQSLPLITGFLALAFLLIKAN